MREEPQKIPTECASQAGNQWIWEPIFEKYTLYLTHHKPYWVTQKKNVTKMRVRTQRTYFLALPLKKQKLPNKDKVQKTPSSWTCIFQHPQIDGWNNQRRQDWRSSMRSSNLVGSMPGEPNRVFFRRFVWSRIFFYKGNLFFWDTKKMWWRKNRLKCNGFLVTVEFYAPFFRYYL